MGLVWCFGHDARSVGEGQKWFSWWLKCVGSLLADQIGFCMSIVGQWYISR